MVRSTALWDRHQCSSSGFRHPDRETSRRCSTLGRSGGRRRSRETLKSSKPSTMTASRSISGMTAAVSACCAVLAYLCAFCRLRQHLISTLPVLRCTAAALATIVCCRRDERASFDTSQNAVEDFELMETLGIGTFAHVRLCRHTSTGQLFALKLQKKHDIVRLQQVEHGEFTLNVLFDPSCFETKRMYWPADAKPRIISAVREEDPGRHEPSIYRAHARSLPGQQEFIHGAGACHWRRAYVE